MTTTYTVEPADIITRDHVTRRYEHVSAQAADEHAQSIADREGIDVYVIERHGGEQRASVRFRPSR